MPHVNIVWCDCVMPLKVAMSIKVLNHLFNRGTMWKQIIETKKEKKIIGMKNKWTRRKKMTFIGMNKYLSHRVSDNQ